MLGPIAIDGGRYIAACGPKLARRELERTG